MKEAIQGILFFIGLIIGVIIGIVIADWIIESANFVTPKDVFHARIGLPIVCAIIGGGIGIGIGSFLDKK